MSEAPTDKANDPVFVSVTLDQPVKRGDTEISEIKLRRPNSGELRGLSLIETGQLQVDSLIKLLPRITSPRLQVNEVEGLLPSDLLALGAEVGNFFAAEASEAGLPDRIDTAMADLFMVFHWSPAITDPMRPSELMQWRAEAADRSEKKQ